MGDANGADKAVQQHLKDRGYSNGRVFAMAGRFRNNLGEWPSEEVTAPQGLRGAAFYAVKDQLMTDRAAVGLMLWDGKSTGTLAMPKYCTLAQATLLASEDASAWKAMLELDRVTKRFGMAYAD